MEPLARYIINACWILFIVVWLLAAISTKRTVYRQLGARRFAYLLPVVIGCSLLFRARRLAEPFNLSIIPHTDALLLGAVILCIVGLAFCFWARAVLGRNWSGTITLKEDHELIVRGPYRFVRHPIYTGLLTMALATAIQQGRLGGFLGFLLIAASFLIKSTHEEAVMLKQFPDRYPAYRERVRRIVPFIL
jgi:protein-S-isoprenylcysteine O-methyltransferase